MNPETDRNLEIQVDQALKALPELQAPRTLMPRVLAALAARAAVPWYRQPWPAWPLGWRVAALTFLLASFGCLCLASFQLTRAAGFTLALQELAQSLSWLGSLWNVLATLGGAAVLVIKHLGAGFLLACAFAGLLGYAVCIALGTACIRLAYARK